MTAADAGFSMPPEWSPQEAVWLSWPVEDPRHWGGAKREMIWAKFAEIAAAFPWFFPGVAFVIGACIGSFLNVVIYRVPQEESIVTPGSHCGCGQPIKFYDNLPILSWLALRGRARCCDSSQKEQ